MKIIKTLVTAAVLAAALPIAGPVSAESAGRMSLGYLYGSSTSSYITQVERSQGALDRVSPSFIDIEADGTLKWADGIESFTKTMHQKQIKVVPFLSNHWGREAGRLALANREALAQEIADNIVSTGLDGINVDIENVTDEDREAFTDLVRLLREKLPKDKEVSVAAAANPNGWTQGWHGSYDMKALAEYADYILLMAYDESYEGEETAGPVASLPWVEKSVQEALKSVPADKLLLGIPFYGRLWSEDGTIRGLGISNRKVEQLTAAHNGSVIYDTDTDSPVMNFTLPEGSAPATVSYKELPAGQSYTVWYENEESIKAKLKLVSKYNLKGSGAWSMGQESAGTWSYFEDWLNRNYFADAEGHWALEDILTAADKGWMTGTATAHFEPDANLTRAQAAAILVRALELPAGTAPAGFTDVPSAHWAYATIAAARSAGLIDGVGGGRFDPEAPLTREQLSAILVRALSLPSAGSSAAAASLPAFQDVTPSRWSYEAIRTLAREGIVSGYPDGTFRAGLPTTRAQMAVLLGRSSGKLEEAAEVRAGSGTTAALPASQSTGL
ncbi:MULTISPECIES: glycosyl hydrolase family 18 protein [Paenibacillus]|uniref:glycosyl hydrolase family 18 protein n=1 Tax=Paenibacillus TaxID=44249 RepID=UPI0022B87C7D|nr:glycosyl hydrolase family 18 protein [Paenibacillus caseinilyticus]MCZ8523439.1 glycosyl hydrolase family 18 protein [Paenibacillus caseinilyticus]